MALAWPISDGPLEPTEPEGETSHRKLREALFLLEERQELAHVGSWVLSLSGYPRLIWSKECYRMAGLPEGSRVELEDFFRIIHPMDIEHIREVRRAAIEDGAPYATEYRIIRTDGAVRWVQVKASVERDSNGQPLRLLGVCQDITEQRQMLDQLRASEQRYRQIVETTSLGVWTIDCEDRTSFMNRRMAVLLGFEPDETIGRPALDFVHESSRDVAKRNLTQRRQGLSEGSGELHLRRKDGSALDVLVESIPITDDCKAYGGSLEMVTDITERRRAEAAIRTGESALRRSEEQLLQAQKMEAIGVLAGGVAHDFNNLLSVILTYAGLSLDTLAPENPLRSDLEEIIGAARRATDLTRQLLAFSRRQASQPRTIDLNTTILGLEKMLRRLLGEDIELSLGLDSDIGCVHADPSQVEQILMNLAVNARDAMPDGGILIIETDNIELDSESIQAHSSPLPPGVYVRLMVSDHGIGMDAATLSRIFEPFFTTKDRDRGTGLGLSTVHRIVEQSGGQINVMSEPGRGATFEILLPRSSHSVAPKSRGRSLSPQPRGAETILVVEDDDQVRSVLTAILARRGYRVLEACNAEDAMLISEQPLKIDLLLTDVVMPRISGCELAERLSAARPDLKVLFVSGYPSDSLAQRGADSELTLLSKPIEPEPLLRKVRSILA